MQAVRCIMKSRAPAAVALPVAVAFQAARWAEVSAVWCAKGVPPHSFLPAREGLRAGVSSK